jgi:signal transduction histidine kinase
MNFSLRLRSIRHKLFAAMLVASLLALVVAGVAMGVYDLRNYHETRIVDLTTQAELIGLSSSAALQFDDRKFAEENLNLLRVRQKIYAGAIYNAKGALFARYVRPGYEGVNLPQLPESDLVRVSGQDLELFKRIVDHNEILGTVYLRSRYEIYDRLWSYAVIVIGVSVLALAATLVLSWWLQTMITRPIVEMTDTARRISKERDFTARARKTTDDEVGILVDSFNAMLAEITHRAEELQKFNRALGQQVEERKQAEKEIQRLNVELEERVRVRTAQLEGTNKELESFSYSVSHDLRAPLRAIDGYSQMLEEDYAKSLDEEGRRLLGVVRQETQKMGRLIDDLLAFARLGRKPVDASVEVDMTGLAKEVAKELLGAEAAMKVKLDIWPLPAVMGDRMLLKQVWINLIGNAVKYSANRPQPEVLVTGEQADGEAVYRVTDNGAGFDMRYASKLFGVFQRLHSADEFPGTGVGLAIVHRIVTKHGGKVRATGKVGEGATFYFTLPAGRDHGQQ